jgi:hypothetical protein
MKRKCKNCPRLADCLLMEAVIKKADDYKEQAIKEGRWSS